MYTDIIDCRCERVINQKIYDYFTRFAPWFCYTKSVWSGTYRHAVVIELCKRYRITLAANGYFKSRLVVNKYCKHGSVSLHILGHDPPLNITTYQDIALNPGPTGEMKNFSQQTRTLFYRNFHTAMQSLLTGCWSKDQLSNTTTIGLYQVLHIVLALTTFDWVKIAIILKPSSQIDFIQWSAITVIDTGQSTGAATWII